MHYLKHLVQHLEREILNKIPQGLFYYFFTTIYYYFFSGFGSTVRHFPYRFLKNSKKKKKKIPVIKTQVQLRLVMKLSNYEFNIVS